MLTPPLWILGFLGLAAAVAFARRDAPTQPYRTFWQRLWAGWLDAFVLWPVELLQWWTLSSGPVVSAITLVACGVGPSLYGIFCHAVRGQTVGKWVFGVCVRNVSEQPMSPWQAVKRDAVPLALSLAACAAAIAKGHRTFLAGPMIFLWIGAGWTLLALVTMLASPGRRALHDHIAGTVVVRVTPLLRRAAGS